MSERSSNSTPDQGATPEITHPDPYGEGAQAQSVPALEILEELNHDVPDEADLEDDEDEEEEEDLNGLDLNFGDADSSTREQASQLADALYFSLDRGEGNVDEQNGTAHVVGNTIEGITLNGVALFEKMAQELINQLRARLAAQNEASDSARSEPAS